MIDAARLLAELKKLQVTLEDDLRDRCDGDTEIDAPLRAQWQAARDANRTAQTYGAWRDEQLTQVAAAWILACVFVRFLEDNALIDPPRLAGPGERRKRALDEHTHYFREHKTDSDRDYLLHVFRAVAELPAAREVFDERHNPLWSLGPTGDGATKLLELFQRFDPDTGALVHDFTDASLGTRFLGDLYQDLSESARKRYALLQTPEFVERFLLDRTLTPAIAEFGFREVRLIDPACGSGHFVLGAFHRLFERWQREEPATNARELVQRALDQVAGVDVNPFAVAIARFRLLIEALRACGVPKLADAPGFHLHVAAGDSLLHGVRGGGEGARQEFLLAGDDPLAHVYQTEDRDALRTILGRRYHVVVGNPPYITPKDAALNQAYRDRYKSCHRKYSLAVPFAERFFDLAIAPAKVSETEPAGFVGMITANSFMKREFGKKLIEEFIPRWDLTHVIDTAGAYIPGHGTPTVILLGRHRKPIETSVRAVMGIRGEPSPPVDSAQGLVWSAIVKQIDTPGSQSEFVSVADVPCARFHEHPWSIGGGGAADAKRTIEEAASRTLGDNAVSIGPASFTGTDEAFVSDRSSLRRLGIHERLLREFVYGEAVRDYSIVTDRTAIAPYDERFEPVPLEPDQPWGRYFWRVRTVIGGMRDFGGKTRRSQGHALWTWYRWIPSRYATSLSITFAEVATHNHFVLDRGGKVFKQTAPVIKLPAGAGEDEHLGLVGLLNSSTACFWMKQVSHCKGAQGINEGGKSEKWEQFYALNATGLGNAPLVAGRPLDLARSIDAIARERAALLPESHAAREAPSGASLAAAHDRAHELREQMIALQEELDWRCYRLYALIDEDLCAPLEALPRVALGERAFEIALARNVAAADVQTQWFVRHGSTPIPEIPAQWPAAYRALVEKRLAAIESNLNLALIEQPEYKRRWNDEPWEEQQARALGGWLLDRLEAPSLWPAARLQSAASLADRVRGDADFQQVAALYCGRADFDLTRLVTELVAEEGVPILPVLRYKAPGLRKHEDWKHTWELQRREDAGEAVGEIPVPPKYTSADFAKSSYWRLRGKLDVPKERFLLIPGAERAADPTPVVGWAGWNHLEQAQALSAHLVLLREQEGASAERVVPLLAGLLELVPWLKQWHNELDPEHGVRLGDYFAGFVEDETRALDMTLDELRAWAPPAASSRSRARRRTTTE